MRSPPWTYGTGDQKEYQDSVLLWKQLHNALPVNNSNKIPIALQAVVLKAQLFGRAKDMTAIVTTNQLVGDEGLNHLLKAIYKRDALTLVNETYTQFNQLCNLQRGPTETMKSFEMRFSAQVSKIQFNCKYETDPGMSYRTPASVKLTCGRLTARLHSCRSISLI